MPKRKITPAYIADHIRGVLKDGGSAPHAEGVQHFFKEEIKSRGWYTGELRKVAVRLRRVILKEQGLDNALVHYLIAPMVAADRKRTKHIFRWAKSRDRWHRRAACVALIQGTRKKMFFPEITRLSNFLLRDQDDMVQKGLGWLLRETAKADAKATIPYLMRIREGAPRLVLRTACETLPLRNRQKVLSTKGQGARRGSGARRTGRSSANQLTQSRNLYQAPAKGKNHGLPL